MRLWFFIFLLINVMVYAFFTYQDQTPRHEKTALPALNAERVRLVSEVQNGSKSAQAETLSCWKWQGLKADAVKAARSELEGLSIADKWTQSTSSEYWVLIPPLRNQAEADKKLAELKGLNIKDGQVIREAGKWRFAISFEAFPTEDEATVRLNQLKEKGVRSAKIQSREVPGDSFTLQKMDEKSLASLKKVLAKFSDSELKQIDCKKP